MGASADRTAHLGEPALRTRRPAARGRGRAREAGKTRATSVSTVRATFGIPAPRPFPSIHLARSISRLSLPSGPSERGLAKPGARFLPLWSGGRDLTLGERRGKLERRQRAQPREAGPTPLFLPIPTCRQAFGKTKLNSNASGPRLSGTLTLGKHSSHLGGGSSCTDLGGSQRVCEVRAPRAPCPGSSLGSRPCSQRLADLDESAKCGGLTRDEVSKLNSTVPPCAGRGATAPAAGCTCLIEEATAGRGPSAGFSLGRSGDGFVLDGTFFFF